MFVHGKNKHELTSPSPGIEVGSVFGAGPPRLERTMHVQVHSDAMALLLILPSFIPIILGTIFIWPGSDSTVRVSDKDDENE